MIILFNGKECELLTVLVSLASSMICLYISGNVYQIFLNLSVSVKSIEFEDGVKAYSLMKTFQGSAKLINSGMTMEKNVKVFLYFVNFGTIDLVKHFF